MKKTVFKKLKTFFSNYDLIKLKRKDLLLAHTEKRIKYIYFLNKGYARQCVNDGREDVIMNIFRPGSFFPMFSVINELPNEFNYRAVTDIEVYRAPRKDVLNFVLKNGDVLLDLTSRLAFGLSRQLNLISFLRLDEAESRVYELLHMLGNRFGAPNGHFYVIDFPLTHQEIASYTGLRRETVSREISSLEDSKKIKTVNRRIWVRKKEQRSKVAKKP